MGVSPRESTPVKYHYSHSFFTYPVKRETGGRPFAGRAVRVLVSSARGGPPFGLGRAGVIRLARPAPETPSGGEFDWGGTSVKW